MRPTLVAFGAALLSLVAFGCANESSGDAPAIFPNEALDTIESTSQKLDIAVRTSPDQPPARGSIDVQFVVTDTSGAPVEGLEITPQLWMPDMGHGASVVPTVKEVAKGTYVFSPCDLFMEGRWELRTSIKGGVDDRATARFSIR